MSAARVARAGRGPVIVPRKGDLAPEDAPDPLWRVRRTVVVDVEMVVTAPDSEAASAISDLVLSDISVQADCARLLRARPQGSPIVERGGADVSETFGAPVLIGKE